jgi:hypothetical protein
MRQQEKDFEEKEAGMKKRVTEIEVSLAPCRQTQITGQVSPPVGKRNEINGSR